MRKCFVVLWENGAILKDRNEDKLWFGGSKNLVYAPVFAHKKDAVNFLRRARRLVRQKASGQHVWVQELERCD